LIWHAHSLAGEIGHPYPAFRSNAACHQKRRFVAMEDFMKSWLFSLHKGPANNTQFFSEVFNGREWSGDVPVQKTGGISNTPGAVAFNNNLYAFYERDHVFYYKSYDGEVWTNEAQVPNTAGVNAGVAAVVFDNRIYLLYSNPNKTALMYKTFDGTTFGAETQAPVNFENLDTPGAAVLGNTMHVFCRGPGPTEPNNTTRLWYAAYDGNLWQGAIVPDTAGIGNGPGATTYDGKIYILFNHPDGVFYFKTWDGRQWSADRQVPNTPGCISNPGAAVYEDRMYVLHQAPNNQFLYKTYDGQNWTPDAAVPNTSGISGGPAAVAFSL
jgi:hypothetical protein